jgi:hypothetical protein
VPSTTDNQYQALLTQYGPGSMQDMRYKRFGGPGSPVKSETDLENIFYTGNNSLNDDKMLYLPGSGSISEKDNVASGGGGTLIEQLLAQQYFYVGHRGSGNVWPEHSAPAYAGAVDGGAKALELSIQRNSEGTWFHLHDAGATGLNRTTDKTGDPSLLTNAQLATTHVVDNTLGQYWITNRPLLPLWTDMMALYFNKVVLFLESKDYSASAVDDMLAKLDALYPEYQKSVIYKVHAGGVLGVGGKAKAKGMKVWSYLDYPLNPTQLANSLALPADYLGVPGSDSVGGGMSDADMATVVATGLPVLTWSPSKRFVIPRYHGLNVRGMVSADVLYTQSDVSANKNDTFATGQWRSGDLPYDSTRSFALPGDGTAVFGDTASNPSVCMGSVVPDSGTNYTIEFEAQFLTVPTDLTTHFGAAFGKADDMRWQFQSLNESPGYHFIQRANGQLTLYTHLTGVSSGTIINGPAAGDACVSGQWMKFKITVTPTAISVTRILGGTGGTVDVTVQAANTAYRGRYFHLSRNYAIAATNGQGTVKYRNVRVTSGDTGNPITKGPTPVHAFWAGDTTQNPGADGPVSQWTYMPSGLVTEGVGGANRPDFKLADPVMNGKPSLVFDGTSKWLQGDVPDLGTFWLVGVGAYNTGSADTTKVMVGTGAASNGGFGRAAPSNKWFSNNGASIVANTGPNADGVPHLIVASFNGGSGNGTIQVDNTAEVVQTGVSTVGLKYFKLGCGATNGSVGSFWAGSLCYAAVFTTDPRLDPKWPAIIEYARSCGVNV